MVAILAKDGGKVKLRQTGGWAWPSTVPALTVLAEHGSTEIKVALALMIKRMKTMKGGESTIIEGPAPEQKAGWDGLKKTYDAALDAGDRNNQDFKFIMHMNLMREDVADGFTARTKQFFQKKNALVELALPRKRLQLVTARTSKPAPLSRLVPT